MFTSNLGITWPLSRSQSLKRPSQLAVTNVLESGEKAEDETGSGCCIVRKAWPVSTSHNRTVLSQFEVSTYLPSADHVTPSISTSCPFNLASSCPSCTSLI